MKRLLILLLFVGVIGLTGCMSASQTDTDDSLPNNEEDQILLEGDDVQDPLVDQIDGENNQYTLFFDDTTTTKTFTLYHQADQQDTVYFINDGFTKLFVTIALPETDTGANLRLTQIIMPDGTMDGPFGLETEYTLTQNGGYQLFFHENMMAGDPWTGNALVTIALQ